MGQELFADAEVAFIDERGGLHCAGDSVVHCWVAVGRVNCVLGLNVRAEGFIKLLGFFTSAVVY